VYILPYLLLGSTMGSTFLGCGPSLGGPVPFPLLPRRCEPSGQGLTQSGRGPWLAGGPPNIPSPYFTGDMPSSGAACQCKLSGFPALRPSLPALSFSTSSRRPPAGGERMPGDSGLHPGAHRPFYPRPGGTIPPLQGNLLPVTTPKNCLTSGLENDDA